MCRDECVPATETGAEFAASSGNTHGLTADEAAAITLYTMEGQFYPILNKLLRTRDRQALKPFFPYIRLLYSAIRAMSS